MAPVTISRRFARRSSRRWSAIPAVVMLGEDIGVYGGAFKVSDGLLERFGWERVIDTPISETAIVGAAVGMSYLGLRPVAELQFIDFIACCFNQITNFVAKSHYRWGAPVPMVHSRAVGRRRAWRAVPFREPGDVLRAHAGARRWCIPRRLRRQGAAEVGDPRQQSGAFFRAQVSLPAHQGRNARGRLHRAARQGRRAARGARFDHRHLRGNDAQLARGGGAPRQRRHRGRGGGSAHAPAARQGNAFSPR